MFRGLWRWFWWGSGPPPTGASVSGTFSVLPALQGAFSTDAITSGTLSTAPALSGTFSVRGVVANVHYIGSDMDEDLTGLRNRQTGDFVNDATVTYELKAPNGTVLSSGTYDYVADSNGNYEMTVESSVTENEVDGQTYYLEVTIEGSSVNDFRRLPRPAQYRGSE